MRPLFRSSLLVVFLGGAACAPTKLTVPRLAPADVDLKPYTRLALGGVAGPGGNEVVTQLATAITATKRFEVIDRPAFAKLINAPSLAEAGRISDESIKTVGPMIGPAVVVVGDVVDMTYTETVEQKMATCSANNRQYDCNQYVRTAIASCKVNLKVAASDTGQVLAIRAMEYQDTRSEAKEGATPKAFKADKQMLDNCNKQLAERFAAVVAPHTVEVTVELVDDGDLPDLKRGNAAAKLGNWEGAVKAYASAVAAITAATKPAAQAKAHYDLGIGYSMAGNHDQGLLELEKAASLEANERTTAALAQVKQFKADDATLANQGGRR